MAVVSSKFRFLGLFFIVLQKLSCHENKTRIERTKNKVGVTWPNFKTQPLSQQLSHSPSWLGVGALSSVEDGFKISVGEG
jgi:hypothetical protein